MPYNPGIQARPFHADMSGWGRALMSMLGDQKAERTERDSLIERYGGKAGQEGVPSAPIYGQIGGDYGSMEGPNEGTGEGGATDEMKAQAKSAKAFRDLGQHLYGYSREELSTKSLGELRGLARKEESAIVQREKTQARQDRLAQFAEVQKQHQIANDAAWTRDMRAAGQQVTNNIRQMGLDVLAEGEFGLRKQIHADTQARYATGQQDAETQRGAVGGFLRDFNQFAEGPQFNGTGMQRPMGQFEAYRQAAGANPRAFTPQMMDDLGRMAVSEDRLSQSALRSFSPTLGTKSVTLADGRVIEIPFGTTSAGGVDWMPQTLAQSGGKALPPVVVTVAGATPGSSTRVPMTAEQYADYQTANPPPAELKKRGDRAALEEELRQHETALKAGNDDRYGFGNAYSRQNRVVELKRKLAELGASPAPAASSPSRGQAIRYKLVNGQLVPE